MFAILKWDSDMHSTTRHSYKQWFLIKVSNLWTGLYYKLHVPASQPFVSRIGPDPQSPRTGPASIAKTGAPVAVSVQCIPIDALMCERR